MCVGGGVYVLEWGGGGLRGTVMTVMSWLCAERTFALMACLHVSRSGQQAVSAFHVYLSIK